MSKSSFRGVGEAEEGAPVLIMLQCEFIELEKSSRECASYGALFCSAGGFVGLNILVFFV
jgi:hypothetical protein